MSDDAWEATVTRKSRSALDGSNLYRRLRVRRADGRSEDIRVGRELWKSIEVGDVLIKQAGHEPVKKHP